MSSPNGIIRCLAPSLMAAVAMVAVALPASAGQHTHRDPGHDVVELDEHNDAFIPAPHHSAADIVTFSTTYTGRTLTLEVRTRTVRYLPALFAVGDFTTPSTGRDRWEVVFGHRHGKNFFELDHGGKIMACPGIAGVAHARRISVTVPSRCFGRPVSVRAGFALVDREPGHVFIDDAQRSGYPNTEADLELGPRITRR